MKQAYVLLLLFLCNHVEFTLTTQVCSQLLPTVEDAYALDEYKKVQYQEGDVLYFSCVPGYTTGFNTTYICTGSGWRAVTIGHCIKDDGSFPLSLGCAPSSLENGYTLDDKIYFYEDGQMARFKCDAGYRMKGKPWKTCINGYWTGDIECQDVHAVLRDVMAKLGELQTKVEELQTLNQGQAAELRTLQTWKVEAGNHLDSLKRDRAVGRVAFSASLLASGKGYTGPFNTSSTLEYKYVILNYGNAYSPNTGKFTAPVRGVYHFSFHAGTGGGSAGTHLSIIKNTGEVCNASEKPSQDEYGTTGNEATVLLEVGDVVFMRLWSGYRVYDHTGHLSTFSGHLLFPL